MNQLYNDGIIVQDFATDTDESVHKSNIAAGKVAFFLDDNSTQWENIHTLNNDLDKSTFVPVECFTQENGDIRNVYEQMYGMWIMVPAASEDKVDACMTYLNWLADPTNAENVAYTPEHEVSENGVPVAFTADELSTMGYKGTLDDYNIVNKHFAFIWLAADQSVYILDQIRTNLSTILVLCLSIDREYWITILADCNCLIEVLIPLLGVDRILTHSTLNNTSLIIHECEMLVYDV